MTPKARVIFDDDDSNGTEDRPERAGGFRCPFCRYKGRPIVTSKVSGGGWVTFWILLLTTVVLCWIGLLIREEVRKCPSCGMRLG